MDIETLRELGVNPGGVKENVTTEGIELSSLRLGQKLEIGEAVLEVTLPCEPCGRMDDIRSGLQEVLRGKRGMLCRVIEAGRIRQGDEIGLRPETAKAAATGRECDERNR